ARSRASRHGGVNTAPSAPPRSASRWRRCMSMAAHLEAKIWAVMGASGSGKGAWIKGQLRHEVDITRLVVWDFMDEYGEFGAKVVTLDALRKRMIKAGAGGLKLRYVPRGTTPAAVKAEFEAICELVYAWGTCVFIAEELSNVTTPSWAP